MGMQTRILIGIVIGTLVVTAGAEHVGHRALWKRYQEAIASRQQLTLQFGEMLATHEQLKRRLSREQNHSRQLTQALTDTEAKLEDVSSRLAQQSKTVRELQVRLASVHEQMDQLQGELAMTLEAKPSAASADRAAPVQLERIVVTDPAAPTLQGRVISVHRDWNFVVVDLGWNAVKIGETVSIFRDDQLLAKARIDRVQEGVCAATVLPEWQSAEIQANDLVRVL